jgi:hypothetical protein
MNRAKKARALRIKSSDALTVLDRVSSLYPGRLSLHSLLPGLEHDGLSALKTIARNH